MMERDPFGERVVCFVCDYGLILLAVLMIVGVAAWRLTSHLATSPLPWISTPAPTLTLTPAITATRTPGIPTATIVTMTPTFTPIPKPEFILVFIPVAWTTDQSQFEQAAQIQANTFIQESHIGDYFTVKVEILTAGPENVDLTDPNLISTVLYYGLSNMPGDRYIGLTDSDLSPDGNSSVDGWTSGGQAMVAESLDDYVTSHEMGHTFGLCDEYNYSAWTIQDKDYLGGCPNPFPSNCPLTMESGVTCDGTQTSDGRNSIMGPSGMIGSYGYNTACLDHLLEQFDLLASKVNP
jgi:hypothetical protein